MFTISWSWLLVACTAAPPGETSEPWDTSVVDTSPPALADLDPSILPAGDAPCRSPVLVRVNDVIDGDTADVSPVAGGSVERVRFIGVNTPEIAHGSFGSDDCWGPEAHAYSRSLLEGRQVWLTFDAACIDPYDRTLSYLHLGAGADDFVNERLLRSGQGRLMIIAPNNSEARRLQDAEVEAKAADAGLWGACF